jgi:hypothetical protein
MSTVEEIVEAIKELPREKQAEVWRRLAAWKSVLANGVDQPNKHSGVKDWLRSKSSLARKRSRPRRPPISVKGKPISETVVEDRR